MSCGFEDPSIRASPARTRSFSCTLMCLPFGIRYSRGSPPAPSGVQITRRLARESWPHACVTVPGVVLALRDQVLARLAAVAVRRHDHAALTARVGSERDRSLDLR